MHMVILAHGRGDIAPALAGHKPGDRRAERSGVEGEADQGGVLVVVEVAD